MVETLCVIAAIHAAVSGCSGVFQVGSPSTLEDPRDLQEELLWPAVEGTCLLMQRSETFHKKGFISSWLVRTLHEKGHTICGTCQQSMPTTHHLSLPVADLRLSLFEAD